MPLNIFKKLKKSEKKTAPLTRPSSTNEKAQTVVPEKQEKTEKTIVSGERINRFLIKHPLITEKGTDLSRLGQYLFKVDKRANKPEIKKAIETIYKVKVVNVRIVNVKPKQRRLGRSQGMRSGYKKAIVSLAPGQKLDILPQ